MNQSSGVSQVFSIYTKAGKTALIYGSREITFPADMDIVLRYIFSKDSISLKELDKQFSTQKFGYLEKTLLLLIREGILTQNSYSINVSNYA